jgi:proline-specific peptidase
MKLQMILLTVLSYALTPLSPAFSKEPISQEIVIVQPFADPDQELMVPVEGGRVYVRVNEGSNKGNLPAIFIHGGPGSTHNSFAQILGLANERPVVLYHQLDSGKSDQPNDPENSRVERFVEELEAVRLAIGMDRWHLVGYSWGAAIALEYTARYPEHVASTVLAGTFISTPRWLTDASLLIEKVSDEVKATLTACESAIAPSQEKCESAFSTLYSKHYDEPPVNPERVAYDKRMGGNGFNALLYNSMWGPSEFSSTGSLVSYHAVPLLSQIDGRQTLFLVGQYDSARIDTVQEFVTLTPGAELAVIPGGSHGSLSDRPIETEAILRGWFLRKDR